MAGKSAGGGKIGRNLTKCKRYKDDGVRLKKVMKRRIKGLKNRERWANDTEYQARQATRKARKETEAT